MAPPRYPLTDPAFDQKMGAQVPLDLTFHDEQGRTIRLGDYLGEKPAILLMRTITARTCAPWFSGTWP